MKKLKITQTASTIDRTLKQKRIIEALGLKKMNQSIEKDATPQVLGMLEKVKHLVSIEEI